LPNSGVGDGGAWDAMASPKVCLLLYTAMFWEGFWEHWALCHRSIKGPTQV